MERQGISDKTNNFKLADLIAKSISLMFHPLFFYAYMLCSIWWFYASFFNQMDDIESSKLIILNIVYTVVFPGIAVVMMKALGMITDLNLSDRKDRIGPFIASAIFYSWTYINIRNTELMPDIAVTSLLGVLISLYLGFIANIFEKVSIHGLAIGGFIAFSIYAGQHPYLRPRDIFDGLSLSHGILLPLSLVLFGVVGWARISLGAHDWNQWIKGSFLGLAGFYLAVIISS